MVPLACINAGQYWQGQDRQFHKEMTLLKTRHDAAQPPAVEDLLRVKDAKDILRGCRASSAKVHRASLPPSDRHREDDWGWHAYLTYS